jgi:KDO2-lipid IV(A) lauroyltransferase
MTRKEKNPRRRAIEQFFVHWVAAGASLLIRLLPLRAVRCFARLFAWVIGTLSYRRQRLMEANLKAVFGDELTARQRREIRKRSVINICKTMAELIKLQWMSEEDVRREVSIEGEEHLVEARARGKGVIMLTAHFGNWEFGGALLSLMGYRINVIARDATDPFTRDVINKARESKGIKIFGRWDARSLLRALKNNECVAILPDQHAADAPVRVEFLGRPADTATGPATFALRTGAVIVPGFSFRGPDDHITLRASPPLELEVTGDHDSDVVTNTQRINDLIGEQIRAHPEQWLWLHDRWKAERNE